MRAERKPMSESKPMEKQPRLVQIWGTDSGHRLAFYKHFLTENNYLINTFGNKRLLMSHL